MTSNDIMVSRPRLTTRFVGAFKSRRSNVMVIASLILLVLFAVITLVGDQLAPQDPGAQDLGNRLLPPGSRSAAGSHPLGTDALGRDLLSLIFAGANTLVAQAAIAVLLGAAFGTFLGMVCGYKGGRLGDLLILLTNLQMSFPFFLLALTVVGILGASFWLVVGVVALASWVEIARVVYAETRSISQLEYILAVRVMRGSSMRVIFRHILPNVLSSVMVLGALSFGAAIVIISGLGFIGLSAPAEYPGWGEVLSDGRDHVASAWWLTVVPGFAIFLLVLAVNVLSESARDRRDKTFRA